MRNKGSLVLMELLVMVLIFALAAGWCLQVFVRADAISRRTDQLDEAVVLAQNAAELLKAGKGDPAAVAELCAQAQDRGYTLQIRKLDSGTPGLAQAEICVYRDQELLFSLQIGWQEVAS